MRALFPYLLAAVTFGCSGGEDAVSPGASGSGGTGGSAGGGGTGGSGTAGSGTASGGGTAGSGTATVSYQRDVAPLFEECIHCHFAGSIVPFQLENPFDPVTGLVNVLGDWTQARHRTLVVPGRPEESFLMDKLKDDVVEATEGGPMPLSMPLPTQAEIDAVRTWITNGALNDAQYQSSVAPLFGNASNLGMAAGKCSFCHTAVSPEPPNLVNPFDTTRGVVNVASERGGMLVVPGDPDASLLYRKVANTGLSPVQGTRMPFQATELSTAQIATIETWIREGALNN